MRPSRIVLLLVALLAGGLAAYLATRGTQPAPDPVVVQSAVVSETQVLVALAPIGVGQRLTAESVGWQNWPDSAVRPEYVTIALMPDAPAQLTGTVARFEFFPGEPIREQKLVRADQGYLSAVLSEGMRGVSIPVTAASGAGGFIVPNDRVDVVLTRESSSGEISETILENVKVLAIGKRLGETGTTGAAVDPEAPVGLGFDGDTIATLELRPGDAETIINAGSIGSLSLALRSIVDFAGGDGAGRAQRQNRSIRVIRYGQELSVMSGSGSMSSDQPASVKSNDAVQTEPILTFPQTGSAPQSEAGSAVPSVELQ